MDKAPGIYQEIFMQTKILVVDDETEIADLIEVFLQNENYEVCKFYTGKEALAYAVSEKIDLAILDVMLPDMDGFEICREIRKTKNFPIIMLTAKEAEIDKITGLTLGADDYMTKPFQPLELIARVKAQLRRATRYNAQTKPEDSGEIIIGGLIIDKNTRKCSLNEKEISLTPTEFEILWVLCENRGQVVSSDDLFYRVWGNKYFTNSNNTIMVHIRHLREKMKDSAENPKYIKTVWGVGYTIEG